MPSKPPEPGQCLGDLASKAPGMALSREWRISLTVAILSHIGFLYGFQTAFHHPPTLSAADIAIEITMVAAPEASPIDADTVTASAVPPELIEPEATPKTPEESNSAPEESEPVPQPVAISELVKTSPSPPPVPAPPVQQVAVVKPVSPAVKADPVVGDVSSARPGLDAATTQAQAGVCARPNYLRNPEPPYPTMARRRRQEGTVLLAVQVSAEGRATHVQLKRTSGYPALDTAATEAVRDWEFEPARFGAKPIASAIEVPIRFQLNR